MNIYEAMESCEQGNFVTNKYFDNTQSMHMWNGSLYYEDGVCLDYDWAWLMEQEFFYKDNWYVKHTNEEIDVEKLDSIHKDNACSLIKSGIKSYEECCVIKDKDISSNYIHDTNIFDSIDNDFFNIKNNMILDCMFGYNDYKNNQINQQFIDFKKEFERICKSIVLSQEIDKNSEGYYHNQIQIVKDKIKHTKKEYEKISLQKELGRLEKELRTLKFKKES